jgi:hypothetical protein
MTGESVPQIVKPEVRDRGGFEHAAETAFHVSERPNLSVPVEAGKYQLVVLNPASMLRQDRCALGDTQHKRAT